MELQRSKESEMETHILEINLISAQGLKSPSANLRRLQTYALAWVDSATKLRTRVDRIGGENPTWNDKFLFRVTSQFLCSETSGVSVEIYAVGCIRDQIVGTVRFLISNLLRFSAVLPSSAVMRTPSFNALQIQRPSGRFHGILNIGAMVIDSFDFVALNGISAIGYRDLMGESVLERRRNDGRRKQKGKGDEHSCESRDNSCGDSWDHSDGADSTSSSSSSTSSTVLKEWNGIRELAGKACIGASNGGILCGLLLQRKTQMNP